MPSFEDRTEAFRHVYEAHYRRVVAYVRRRLAGPDADDAVAETFLIAWRRFEDVPAGDLTLAWLYGVARKVVSQAHRSGRRRARLASRIQGGREAADTDVDALAEQQVVHSALARLRPEDQELLRLAEWEELRPDELAVVFGCSANAVAIRLHRARRRFERVLRLVDAEPEAVPAPEASR